MKADDLISLFLLGLIGFLIYRLFVSYRQGSAVAMEVKDVRAGQGMGAVAGTEAAAALASAFSVPMYGGS